MQEQVKVVLQHHLQKKPVKMGKNVLYFAFEESPKQIIRNMRSIGIDLQTMVDKGL